MSKSEERKQTALNFIYKTDDYYGTSWTDDDENIADRLIEFSNAENAALLKENQELRQTLRAIGTTLSYDPKNQNICNYIESLLSKE